MAFYIAFIFSLIFLFGNYTVGGRRKPYLFTALGILIVIAVIALRFDIGVDYSTYYEDFARAIKKNELDRFEPFNMLFFYMGVVFDSPSLIIALYGIATPAIALYAISRNTDNFFIGAFTYICIFYLFAFSIMRQAIAMAILIYGYRYMADSRNWRYLAVVVVAGMFHYSAFIALFFPLIYRYCSPRIMILSLGLMFGVIYFGIGLIERIPVIGSYARYLEVINQFEGGTFQRLFMWALLGFLWIFRRRDDKEASRLLVLCTFGAIFPVLLGSHLGGRLAQYFYIFMCICAPMILTKRPRIVRTAYLFALLCWFFAYIYIAVDDDSKAYIPYQTVFDANLDHPVFK